MNDLNKKVMKNKNDIIEKAMLVIVGIIAIYFAVMLVLSIISMINFIQIDYF